MQTFPTLRIELEGLKQGIVAAFHAAKDDLAATTKALVKEALDRLTPDYVVANMRAAVGDSVDHAIKQIIPDLVAKEVHEYFTKGAGAARIREAVLKSFVKGDNS